MKRANTDGPTPAEQALIDTLSAIQRGFEETQVRLERSLGAVQLHGALAMQVGTGGTTRPAASAGSLVGGSLRNTGAGAAIVIIRDGRDATAPVIASISLAIAESKTPWFGPDGLAYTDGLFIDLIGTIEGAVYLRAGE